MKCRKYPLFLIIVIGVISAKSTEAVEIPKGKIEKFIYSESKIFPGTEREVFVYIPQQLNKTKPACVYVQQDGLRSEGFTNTLDSLIAQKEIPVMVGVFVNPGSLSPPGNNPTSKRQNRSFEYDGLGDNYARFILEEILPFVEQKYGLALSKNGNDRAIGGVSSGGIAAFNAAWERPDAFTRVYCNSGSFVAFRGGHKFPILVRKTEPKPIRMFLTTGTDDMENAAGDWTLIDLQMEKALKFSGYDYQFKLLDGKHGVGYEQYFADAMRFIWKGWPEPVKTGAGAPGVQDIILENENWKMVTTEYFNSCGATSNEKGEVFFFYPLEGKICKIGTDGQIKAFKDEIEDISALTVNVAGTLFSVSAKTGNLMEYDNFGNSHIYAENVFGQFITAKPAGGFYVTSGTQNNEPGKVWLVEKGKQPLIVDSGLKKAVGITISSDRWLLALADEASHWVYSYEIKSDGSLTNKENYFWLHTRDYDDESGATTVCYDKEGHLYAATKYGVQVCGWDGPVQVILPLPEAERVHDICFGGADHDILFAFCKDKIYQRKLKTHGIGAYSPWMKRMRGKL